MSIWALGRVNEPARCYVETSDAQTVIDQMEPNEHLAPVTASQREAGVVILGNMQCADIMEPSDG